MPPECQLGPLGMGFCKTREGLLFRPTGCWFSPIKITTFQQQRPNFSSGFSRFWRWGSETGGSVDPHRTKIRGLGVSRNKRWVTTPLPLAFEKKSEASKNPRTETESAVQPSKKHEPSSLVENRPDPNPNPDPHPHPHPHPHPSPKAGQKLT